MDAHATSTRAAAATRVGGYMRALNTRFARLLRYSAARQLSRQLTMRAAVSEERCARQARRVTTKMGDAWRNQLSAGHDFYTVLGSLRDRHAP